MSSVFKGFETKEITLESADLNPGEVAMFTDSLVVYNPEKNQVFCGVCNAVREGYASVVINGYAKTTFTGSAPHLGYQKLSSNGEGGVMVDEENGREYLIVGINGTESTVEFIVK